MTQKNILLVEDNDDDIQLTIRALRKNQIINKVVVVNDGVAALDILLGRNGVERMNPALVLLDLKMPRMGGLEVLEVLKKDTTIKCPVIILTTSNEEDDVVRSYELGANSYIRKPVDFSKFTKTVAQLGMYWLVLNEPFPDKEE